MNRETQIFQASQKFRNLAKKIEIGVSAEKDLEYMNMFKSIAGYSTFQKQDNLLLPSPSLVLHEQEFSLVGNPAKDIYSPPAYQHYKEEENTKRTEREICAPPIKYKNQNLKSDFVGLILRSYMVKTLDVEERKFLKDFMFSVTPQQSHLYQEKCWEIFSSFIECKNMKTQNLMQLQLQKLKKMAGDKFQLRNLPQVDIKSSKGTIITFNSSKEKPCKLNQKYSYDLVVKNKKKLPCKFRLLNTSTKTKDYDLIFQPNVTNFLELKKGQSTTIKIHFNPHRPLHRFQELIVIEVEGGRRHFFGIHAHVETKSFGIDPSLLECVEVEGIGKIPKVLEHMKSEMLRNDGLEKIGIFRKAGHEIIMKQIIKSMDSDKMVPCRNVHNFATLIKIWFRSLPQKIFDHYPTSYYQQLDAKNTASCLDTLNGLPEMSRNLINWLLEFMMLVEANSEINMMNTSNLAIVFSPNLYCVKSKNPATLMMMTSKMSQFFQTLLELRIAQSQDEFYEDEGEFDDDYDEDEGENDEDEGEYEDDDEDFSN